MTISTTFIKSIQDIMRQDAGVDGDAQRISQLSWLLFLKIFDDQETELELMRDDYQSPLPEAMRWRNWAANQEGITGDALQEFINNALFPRLKNLNADPLRNPRGYVVQQVFEDAFNYMKSGHRAYEHPYPAGYKSYSKTKPIRIEEFAAEKAWWGDEADGFKSRVENELAWKVDLVTLKANGYNLDQKNPHSPDAIAHDPDALLAEYGRLTAEAQSLRDQLKGILAESLGTKSASSPPKGQLFGALTGSIQYEGDIVSPLSNPKEN